MLARLVMAVALVCTATTPSLGQVTQFAEPASHRNGASAGAYVRIALDRPRTRAVRPQLGLRIAATQDFRDSLTGRGAVTERDVIDFRLSGMSRPTLLVAGTPVTGPQAPRMNGLGTGEAIAIGGGVLLILVVVALAAAGGTGFGDTCPVFDGNRDHCID